MKTAQRGKSAENCLLTNKTQQKNLGELSQHNAKHVYMLCSSVTVIICKDLINSRRFGTTSSGDEKSVLLGYFFFLGDIRRRKIRVQQLKCFATWHKWKKIDNKSNVEFGEIGEIFSYFNIYGQIQSQVISRPFKKSTPLEISINKLFSVPSINE